MVSDGENTAKSHAGAELRSTGDKDRPRIDLFNKIKWGLLPVVIGLLVFYVLDHRNEFNFLLTIEIKYLFLIVLLDLVGIPLAAYRFHLVLKSISHRIPFLVVFKHHIIGQFLPQGGNLYRAVMLKKSDDISYEKYIAVMLSLKWMAHIFSLLLGIIVISIYNPQIKFDKIPLLPLFVVLLLFQVLFVVLSPALYRKCHLKDSLYPLKNYVLKAVSITNRVFNTIKDRTLITNSFLIIFINTSIGIFVLHLFFKSIHSPTNLVTLTIYVIFMRLSTVITLTPSNIGIREFLFGFLSHSMGTGLAQGIAVSVMARIVTFGIQGMLSVIMLLVDDKRKMSSNDMV